MLVETSLNPPILAIAILCRVASRLVSHCCSNINVVELQPWERSPSLPSLHKALNLPILEWGREAHGHRRQSRGMHAEKDLLPSAGVKGLRCEALLHQQRGACHHYYQIHLQIGPTGMVCHRQLQHVLTAPESQSFIVRGLLD